MSGKVRQRVSANAADSASSTVNERILKECHTLYTDPENGELMMWFDLQFSAYFTVYQFGSSN